MNTQTRFPRTRASVEAGVIATLPVVSPATRPLTAGERKELLECETKIYSGLDQIGKCWREIAQRWRHILDEKLYREDFRTIEAYTRAKFGKSAARLRQLLRAEGVMQDLEEGFVREVQSLESNVPRPKQMGLPTTEGQVRALVPLSKEKRQSTWAEAVAAVGEGKMPTVKDVKSAADRWGELRTDITIRPSAPLMADRKPAPEFAANEAIRKRILEASQRAVVGIRALQDLVMGKPSYVQRCNEAVDRIVIIEDDLKALRTYLPGFFVRRDMPGWPKPTFLTTGGSWSSKPETARQFASEAKALAALDGRPGDIIRAFKV